MGCAWVGDTLKLGCDPGLSGGWVDGLAIPIFFFGGGSYDDGTSAERGGQS